MYNVAGTQQQKINGSTLKKNDRWLLKYLILVNLRPKKERKRKNNIKLWLHLIYTSYQSVTNNMPAEKYGMIGENTN